MAKKEDIWTNKEIEILRTEIERGSTEDAIALKLNRSRSAVMHKKNRIGINTGKEQGFTKEEENKILELRKQKVTIKQISKILNRTYSTVKGRVYEMDNRIVNSWNEEEVKLLKKLFLHDKMRLNKIARFLKKPLKCISEKLNELELRTYVKHKWNKDNQKELMDLLDAGLSINELSIKINRGKFAIIDQCKKLGIRKKYKQIKEFLYLNKNNHKEAQVEKVLLARLNQAKARAKQKNIEFNLSLIDLLDKWTRQKGLCFYSGTELSTKRGDDNVISIDRVNSSKGYVKDNIVLTTWVINIMKMDSSSDLFFNNCWLIVKHMSENIEF